ncbi:hypothetical protein Pla163_06800 [Planctomycetes bacterium Pla163]|jgi:hypothetical protein|uniref:GYF domain-containing protein n=1 Tax=Rohdeia mirabilis TaxID=2528008 RepID=A0A518CWH1_9BACT|nr:hypothetical protein Pla163_06800 [Planctomycetes bacterium Pla163]
MEFAGSSLLFAILCAVFASSKGRSALGWFFVGLFLSFVGLIILAVLPDLKEDEKRQQALKNRQSHLKEQVRQERQRREAFEGHTLARLDAHDRHAGIDTRAGAPPPLPAAHVQIEEARWYFEQGGESRGPITESELRDKFEDGELGRGTLVWCEGMEDWAPARSVAGLA